MFWGHVMQPNSDIGINHAGELLALISLAENLQERAGEFGADLSAILAGAVAEDLRDILFNNGAEHTPH